MQEKWVKLKSINEILAFVQANPEYKPFLDKPIKLHAEIEFIEGKWNWDSKPDIRFSVDHDALVIETNMGGEGQ